MLGLSPFCTVIFVLSSLRQKYFYFYPRLKESFNEDREEEATVAAN